MIISHLSQAVRYIGRWCKRDKSAVTTALGAIMEIAFTGTYCDLRFSVILNAEPYPHVYVQLDDGAKTEARVDHYIRVEAPEYGNHVVKVILKSSMEDQQRWYEPLVAKLEFISAEAEREGTFPNEHAKIIEFIGDSITEGIWVDQFRAAVGNYQNHLNMVFENDSTATYAFLTAKALGMQPYIMGYGSVGITKAGGGGVPKVADAYPYCFHNCPREASGAEIIVINHGANDYLADAEDYTKGYEDFLDLVRAINPAAKIVVLSPFAGQFQLELGEMVKRYNQSRGVNVKFIDSFGWVPKEPLHPARESHQIIADKLTQKLKEIFDI